jgi:replicative DNA helicase
VGVAVSAASLGAVGDVVMSAAHSIHVRSYDELAEEYVKERTQENFEPVRLGFGSIDADIRGISPGQVMAFAARTATGKTWMLNSVTHGFAVRRDVGQLSLSLEMPGPEWLERQLAIHLDEPPERIEELAKDGGLGSEIGRFLERMRHALVIDQPLSLHALPGAFNAARERLGDVPLRLVVIDYLGLLEVSGRDAYERASTIGKGLKNVAKQERVAVVVAMQLSRAAGDGHDAVTLSMLRDSGVLEEAMDFVVGAWRPGKAANLDPITSMELRDVLRVALLKNRKGLDGRVVDLRFRPDSRQVYEPAEIDV